MEIVSDIRRMDVMIIDPDKVSRGNLAALARDFGCYSIRPFDNVEEAIVSILNKPPKLAIVHWGEDGALAYKLLREIRCDPRDEIARTPIVIETADMGRSILSKGLQWGATQFLEWPVVPAKLKQTLIFVRRDKRDTVRHGGRLHYVARPRNKAKPVPSKPNVQIKEFSTADNSSALSGHASQEFADPDDILEI